MEEMTGAQIFIESLKRQGVDTVFGLPGGVVLFIYDEIYKSDLRHILVRHEQGAVHMAEGYAKATGKVGVALVTSGPGATNTVTGIVDAFMDSVPIVVFTGQVSVNLIGNDAFQEADIVGMTRVCTKHNYLVKDVRDLARTIREAFYIAATGRPGPVLVDIPKDVTTKKAPFEWPERVHLRGYHPTTDGHVGQVKKGIQLILEAQRPLLYVGGGATASGAHEELTRLSDLLGLPAAATLMGLGSFPGDHPQYLGMLGMHGTYSAVMAMQNADLLVSLGARFDDRVTGKLDGFAPKAKVVHVDVDPSNISKNVRVEVPIVGDVRNVLKRMVEEIEHENPERLAAYRKGLDPWWGEIRTWQKDHPLRYADGGKGVKPQYVVEKVYEVTRGRAIYTTDVGQHQMWAAQYFRGGPRCFITSGGLGTMGFGFPAAIGAQVARPDLPVVCISGDGSFQMNVQELATAVQYKLPVKVVILNNFYLGMVRQWQELFYGRRYSGVDLHVMPDFVKLAEAYGAVGFRVDRPEEVVPALERALKSPLPALIDVRVAEEENVYPMVPAGSTLDQILTGPARA